MTRLWGGNTTRLSLRSSLLVLALILMAAFSSPASAAGTITLQPGDVIYGSHWSILSIHPDGTAGPSITTDSPFFFATGFDAANNLWALNNSNNSPTKLTRFTPGGVKAQVITNGLPFGGTALALTRSGGLHIGSYNVIGSLPAPITDPTLSTQFSAPYVTGMDLAPDQCTIYAAYSGWLTRFDACTGTQLSQVTLPYWMSNVRILPDGSLIVVGQQIQRIQPDGTLIRDYPNFGSGATVQALTLDPDGTSFWTANTFAKIIRKIDIASGEILKEFTAADLVYSLTVVTKPWSAEPAATPDTAAPVTTVTRTPAAGGQGWNNGPVSLAFSATDTAAPGSTASGVRSISVTVNGTTQSCPAGAACTVTIAASGTHSVQYRATDAAGNAEATQTLTVLIDTTAPSTTASAPTGWVPSATVAFTATDNLSGVAATYYAVDGGAVQTGNQAVITADGTHSVVFYSQDRAGNSEAVAKAVSVPANVLWSDSGVNVTSGAPLSITATGTAYICPGCARSPDGLSEIFDHPQAVAPGLRTASLVGKISSGAPFQVGSQFAGAANATGRLYFAMNDFVWGVGDNTGAWQAIITTKKSVTVQVDATAPTITGAPDRAANAAGWYNADVTVSFTCADALSGLAACAPAQRLGEGAAQTATGTATDKAGNSASDTVKGINIDMTPPVTTATPNRSANGNGWYNTDVTVALSATDNLSAVTATEYSLNGGAWTAYTAPFAISEGGVHSVAYRSRDAAENLEAAGNLTVRIDKTAPESVLQFDPIGKDLQVLGKDDRSGVASGPMAPVSVTPVGWGSGDWDGDDDKEKDKDKDKGHGDARRGSAELRTYLVSDLAGNTVQVKVLVRKDGRELKARIVSLQYSGGAESAPVRNKIQVEWSNDKGQGLKELEQQFSLGQGRTAQGVEAKYNARSNETIIKAEREEQKGEHKARKTVLPGLVLLRIRTSQSALVIDY